MPEASTAVHEAPPSPTRTHDVFGRSVVADNCDKHTEKVSSAQWRLAGGTRHARHHCCCFLSSEAPVVRPREHVPQRGWGGVGGGSWPRARGPCRRARRDEANNLQMLACIRAWRLVMSPPTLPHSSITSHLLPTAPGGEVGVGGGRGGGGVSYLFLRKTDFYGACRALHK